MLQELGFGLTHDIVSRVISDFLSTSGRVSPFAGGLPGADWWTGFMQRWPTLSERKPQHLSSARAACANPDTISSWFSRVEEFFKVVGLIKSCKVVDDFAYRLWNCDESGFCLGLTSKKILARKGSRAVHEVGGSSDHQYITVNICGSAAGVRLPAFILYKGKNLYNTWMEGGPAGAGYGVSSSGWMEEMNLFKWFEQQFYPSTKHLVQTGPVVLFFDGHYSHLSIALIKRARQQGIHLFCLPPNTTHILQPLDVGVFSPVKSAWRKILKEHKIRTRASNITKDVFPSLVKQLFDRSFKPDHFQGGLRSAGLCPLDPSVIKASRLAPSLQPVTTATDAPDSPQTPTIHINATGTMRIGGTETPIRVELQCNNQ